ncbi:MAG: hypothetical protein AAGE65_06975 [Planctomycetota bacterium]
MELRSGPLRKLTAEEEIAIRHRVSGKARKEFLRWALPDPAFRFDLVGAEADSLGYAFDEAIQDYAVDRLKHVVTYWRNHVRAPLIKPAVPSASALFTFRALCKEWQLRFSYKTTPANVNMPFEGPIPVTEPEFLGCLSNCRRVGFHSSPLTGIKFDRHVYYEFFRGCDIRGVSFANANLEGAEFIRCEGDHTSSFLGVHNVEECAIDRYTLSSLGSDRGGLTTAQQQKMILHDPVVEMRKRFSGFWRLTHALLISLFLAPYLWFLLCRYYAATIGDQTFPEGTTTSIAWALVRFILTGGDGWWRNDWSVSVPAALSFMFVFVYQCVRAILLFKTQQLESYEKLHGLPANFEIYVDFGSVRKEIRYARELTSFHTLGPLMSAILAYAAYNRHEALYENGTFWGKLLYVHGVLAFIALFAFVINFGQFLLLPTPLAP